MVEAGIITLHFSVNYGAVLQCLALSETLKKHQIHATVINYYPRYAHYYWEPVKRYSDAIRDAIRSGKSKSATGEDLRKPAVVRCLKSLKYVYKANQEADSYRKKYNAFREFVTKNLLLTEQYEDITEMENLSFDLLISGSDQVWNSNYTDYTLTRCISCNSVSRRLREWLMLSVRICTNQMKIGKKLSNCLRVLNAFL